MSPAPAGLNTEPDKRLLKRDGVLVEKLARVLRALAGGAEDFGGLTGGFFRHLHDALVDVLLRAVDDALGLVAQLDRLVGDLRDGIGARLAGGLDVLLAAACDAGGDGGRHDE